MLKIVTSLILKKEKIIIINQESYNNKVPATFI